MVNFPINLQIGNLIVPPHLIFDILAFSFGFYLYINIRRKRKDFLHSEDRWNIILGGVIGALILSRLLASLENPSLFFNPPNFLYYIQGKTIVGGLIGAILGVEITKKILNKRYNLKKGVLFKAFIIFYLVFRFIIEFIKPINPLFYNMSSIQITGFIMSIYYIKFLFKNGVVKNE